MTLIRTLAEIRSSFAWKKFLRACKNPERSQEQNWKAQIHLMEGSAYWRERLPSHHLADFPITTYADYLQTLEGDYGKIISSLNGERIIHWAESTGTTGKRKMLPLTRSYKKQFQSLNLPVVSSWLRRFPNFLNSKFLYLTSVGPTDHTPAGIGIGFISGYNYLHTPKLLARAYALPSKILSDSATYEEWAPIYAAAADLGGIVSITPARIRQLVERIWERRGEILEIVRANPILASPLRFKVIEAALSEKTLRLCALWPNLEFIGSWKTSGCAPQVDTIRRYLEPGIAYIDVMYSATEGWINVPLDSEKNGGPVHPGGVICEFIEVGLEIEKENILPLWKLEVGKTYEIFLTNKMGLVRYRLFDLVKCTGFFHRSPIIEFVGKASREFMLGRLRIGELQLYEVLSKAGVDLPVHEICFSRAASGDHLVLLVKVPRTVDFELAQHIESALTELNPYYASDRKTGMLKEVEVVLLPKNHALWADSIHAQVKPRIFTEVW